MVILITSKAYGRPSSLQYLGLHFQPQELAWQKLAALCYWDALHLMENLLRMLNVPRRWSLQPQDYMGSGTAWTWFSRLYIYIRNIHKLLPSGGEAELEAGRPETPNIYFCSWRMTGSTLRLLRVFHFTMSGFSHSVLIQSKVPLTSMGQLPTTGMQDRWDLYNASVEVVKISYKVFPHCKLSKASTPTTGALLLVIVSHNRNPVRNKLSIPCFFGDTHKLLSSSVVWN